MWHNRQVLGVGCDAGLGSPQMNTHFKHINLLWSDVQLKKTKQRKNIKAKSGEKKIFELFIFLSGQCKAQVKSTWSAGPVTIVSFSLFLIWWCFRMFVFLF